MRWTPPARFGTALVTGASHERPRPLLELYRLSPNDLPRRSIAQTLRKAAGLPDKVTRIVADDAWHEWKKTTPGRSSR